MNKYAEKIERSLLRLCRSLYKKCSKQKNYLLTLNNEEVNEFIYERIMGDKPFMCARFGSTEFAALQAEHLNHISQWQRRYVFIKGLSPNYEPNAMYELKCLQDLCTYSGYIKSKYPHDNRGVLYAFYEEMISAMHEVDVLGCWLQELLFLKELLQAQTCALGMLEPYDYENPWSRALAGKKVLVVHPFAETIEAQYQKREYLWKNPDVLPQFELHTIKAVQSIAGEKVPYDTWFDALHHMEQQMDAINYDIAIIGCGAYGFSLAAHAKRMGKKSVHLGGATQILFGIKGKRWDELPAVNKFYNEYWVYPSAEDTPKHKERVEGGCYW